MLAYDWMWWGQLINQNLAQRCAEVHGGVRRGVWRCAEGCMEVHRGVQRCVEVFQRGGGEKNQDFMFIRFLNAGI